MSSLLEIALIKITKPLWYVLSIQGTDWESGGVRQLRD